MFGVLWKIYQKDQFFRKEGCINIPQLMQDIEDKEMEDQIINLEYLINE